MQSVRQLRLVVRHFPRAPVTLFLFTDEGNLIRARLSPAGYREISRSHLIDPTWPFDGKQFVYAPPAFANGHVIARSEAEVICASLEKRP